MKFRIIVSILTVIIIALFITSVYYATELRVSLDKEIVLNSELKSSQAVIYEQRDSLQLQKDSLELVMKSLNVWETDDQKAREKEVARSEYTIIVLAEAKYEDLYDVISYSVGSGFGLKQARKQPGGVPVPRIFYYKDAHKSVAEEYAKELEAKYQNLSTLKIEKGATPRAGIDLIVNLRFTY